MNPLWGLKLTRIPTQCHAPNQVPKSMNPLWGLKLNIGDSADGGFLVHKSMNPLWGLKPTEDVEGCAVPSS